MTGSRYRRDTTTVRIPRQRHTWGRRQTPIVLVVPEQPTLGQRLAAALGRAAWKRRRAALPLLGAVTGFAATAVVHAVAPWTWLPLALAATALPAWLAWVQRQRPSTDPRVRTWRYALAAVVLTAGAWAAASVAVGPTAGPLPLLWLALTIAIPLVRRSLRRSNPTAHVHEPSDITQPVEKEYDS
ncbi:hypothetical protein ACSNOH_07170 [Streptomyces sp. URMC 127]|uniref:hypothetical protein n=1 Tax=Streptomyces sp. URMC 127 TaxID=3423402 RepID=UPI003F1B8697